MKQIRSYIAGALALVLVLTGQTMAVARGAPVPVDQIVICTGNGLVAVARDSNGNPVSPPHICPDCALSLFVALETVQNGPIAPDTGLCLTGPKVKTAAILVESVTPQSRGPPLSF